MHFNRGILAVFAGLALSGCADPRDATSRMLREWAVVADAMEEREPIPVEIVELAAFLDAVSDQGRTEPPWETLVNARIGSMENVAVPPGAGFVECVRTKPQGLVWRLICDAYFDDSAKAEAFLGATFDNLAERAHELAPPEWKSDGEWREAVFHDQNGSEFVLRTGVVTNDYGPSRTTVTLVIDRPSQP